jgi:sRNA-binding carbon storage regulator CsrA
MLCLGLKRGRMITIQCPDGTEIVIRFYEMGVDQIKLGFSAPREYKILRNELIKETPDEDPLVNPDWMRDMHEAKRKKR